MNSQRLSAGRVIHDLHDYFGLDWDDLNRLLAEGLLSEQGLDIGMA